jgi:hypothetical protein
LADVTGKSRHTFLDLRHQTGYKPWILHYPILTMIVPMDHEAKKYQMLAVVLCNFVLISMIRERIKGVHRSSIVLPLKKLSHQIQAVCTRRRLPIAIQAWMFGTVTTGVYKCKCAARASAAAAAANPTAEPARCTADTQAP